MEIWSPFYNKTGIPLSGGYISATEMYGEKARWELLKNALCSFQQILEVTLH